MKIFYQPPKVKINKKKKAKPLPEWNDSINDLGKYKLSSSEIVKFYLIICKCIFLFLVTKKN